MTEIFPAVDIRAGRAVRLLRGDFERETVYDASPVAAAKRFAREGARNLHVVDLDGAREGRAANRAHICEILQNTSLRAEVGGGVRTLEAIEDYLAMGAYRVILGTKALEDGAFLRAAARACGEKLAVGVDAANGRVAVRGWETVTDEDAHTFVLRLRDAGVKTVIYTDISRDGAMNGANLAAYEALVKIDGLKIVASGGVSSREDVRALCQAGVSAIILGRALYEGALTLRDALAEAEETTC